jgi:hypothetical protein
LTLSDLIDHTRESHPQTPSQRVGRIFFELIQYSLAQFQSTTLVLDGVHVLGKHSVGIDDRDLVRQGQVQGGGQVLVLDPGQRLAQLLLLGLLGGLQPADGTARLS